VAVERVGPERVGQVSLELRRPRGQHRASVGGRAGLEVDKQPGLADPGLALDRDDAAPFGVQRLERARDRLALTGASDEGRRRRGHAAILA
jgi:hypothetical protein